jgi:hypothetical protein
MTEEVDLGDIMRRARTIWELYQALLEVGFNEHQASLLLPQMMLAMSMPRPKPED